MSRGIGRRRSVPCSPRSSLSWLMASDTEKTYAPARHDPSSLLQPKERGIEHALIQVEDALGHLEDPRSESEPVLRPDRSERPQQREIEGTCSTSLDILNEHAESHLECQHEWEAG